MSYRASRQSKWVDLDRAASASAGPPANRPPHSAAEVGLSVGSVTGGPSGCRTGGGRRPRGSAAAPAVTTMMVSSPAMVPRTPSSPAWSSAEARKLRGPGGVRRTTRLAEWSAETSSSWQRAWSRVTRSSPSAAARTVRSPPSPGTAYTRFFPTRTRSAPTSTRSRDSVAWVTSMPSVGEVVEQLGLRAHGGRREDLDDPLLARGARGGDGHRASPAACCSTSHESRAFCACRRFSACCHTSDGRAVDDLGVDLDAPVGGQAVEEHGIRGGPRHQRRGDAERRERGCRPPCVPPPRTPGPSTPRCR